MNLKALFIIFKLELDKIFRHRFQFWSNFILILGLEFAIAWFFWSAVYYKDLNSSIDGFNFYQILFYSVLSPVVFRAVSGLEANSLWADIANGSIVKFHTFPIPLTAFRYVSSLPTVLFYLVQLLLGLFLYQFYIKGVSEALLYLPYLLLFSFSILLSSMLSFFLFFICETFSYWVGEVWAFSVINRFLISFLGGLFIPLEFYPQTVREILHLLPFKWIIYFPIQIALDKLNFSEILTGNLIQSFWILILFLAANRFFQFSSTNNRLSY